MDVEGWNFTDRNPYGPNIFIFRDTWHKSSVIHEKIFSELLQTIDKNYFKDVFVELPEADLALLKEKYEFKTATEKKKPLLVSDAVSNVIRLATNPAYSHLRIHGADNHELRTKNLAIAKEAEDLYFEIMQKKENDSQYLNKCIKKMKALNNEMESVYSQRTQKAIEIITEYMNKKNISSAALIFGELHFQEFKKGFKRRNMGCISYYPGKFDSSSELEQKAHDFQTRI